MRKIKTVPVFFALLMIFSCSRPHQIKERKSSREITFWNIKGGSELDETVNLLSKWEIDCSREERELFATLTTDWVLFENIEYAQSVFYFNDKKKLYKIRAYLAGDQNIQKIKTRLSAKYAVSREKGQKPSEIIYKGKENSKAVLSLHSSEGYCTLQIDFNTD
ncbi:MAG: hypothetical protein J5780_03175 [Treponema sp.]|nr:hypothetical protein [Treponema sp.]